MTKSVYFTHTSMNTTLPINFSRRELMKDNFEFRNRPPPLWYYAAAAALIAMFFIGLTGNLPGMGGFLG